MNGNSPYPLTSDQGRPVPLTGVEIRGVLAGPLFEATVVQRFRNDGERPIEALYTFPVPPRAVLLGLKARLGERQFEGVVTAREQAREGYEEMIAEGDSALLLERIEEGMFSLALGNLLPGEEAELEFRYALPLRFEGNRLRIALPTTLAPRYGEPAEAGLEPYQVPTVSLAVEYPFNLEIRVGAPLSRGTIASPTHAIATRAEGDQVRVTLARHAWLDRDFVLEILLAEASPAWAGLAKEGDETALLLAFAPRIGARREQPLNLKLLVDCSGSMLGDSIEQARTALAAVLAELRPKDRLSLTRFGSRHEHFHARMAAADLRNLFVLRDGVARLEADLGGTEMQEALEAVFALPGADGVETLLLITDGEIYNSEATIEAARSWGHRLFVVGVGSAVSEAFLRRLAEESGGAAEFVAPNEEMAAAILRQFERMRAPRIMGCRVAWPVAPLWETPVPMAIFGGDTVWISAGLEMPSLQEMASLGIGITLQLDDGSEETFTVPLEARPQDPDLPRIAAALRLPGLAEPEAEALALRHRLLAEGTAMLLTLKRAAGAQGDAHPDLAPVPHMLAAGWGGTGGGCDAITGGAAMPPPPAAFYPAASLAWADSLSATCTYSSPREPTAQANRFGPSARLSQALAEGVAGGGKPPETLDDLLSLTDLPAGLVEAIRQLIAEGWTEEEAVKALLAGFVGSDLLTQWLGDAADPVRKAWEGRQAEPLLVSWFASRLPDLFADDEEDDEEEPDSL